MQRPPAVPTVQIDNDQVTVTEWRFPPGGETGWHRHGMDYVITTLTPCAFQLEMPGGETVHNNLEAGVSYRRDEGVEHNVINGGDKPMSFVEVELK